MTKKQEVTSTEPSPWDTEAVAPTKLTKPEVKQEVAKPTTEFDLEGLMTDFPTAKDLERFVFDQTGIVLNLKGRANKLKYQVAMDCLNGIEVDPAYTGGENPYIDKAEMVPVEELKDPAPRDAALPQHDEVQNQFYSPFIPHPNEDYRARGKKVHTVFRKYTNGMISYEVLGPIEPKPIGQKMDKFGNMRPEIMSWVDPRTGEQLVQRADGSLTPQGRNLRAIMQKLRVNNTNHWAMWVDRDFVNVEGGTLQNPWDLS